MHHIMFDVDGTLVNSFDYDETCFISAVSEVLGHEIDSDWDSYTHVSDTGILTEHLLKNGITAEHQQIKRSVKNAFIANIKCCLSSNPVSEISGAAELIRLLKNHDSVSLSIATGGWSETALIKLDSAGIDVSGIPLASSNDHYARKEIMKMARIKAGVCENTPITYFGDAAWDKKACSELGYNFVLVGNRIQHTHSVNDLKNIEQILSLIGI